MRRVALSLVLALSACAVADDDAFEDEVTETEQDATTVWYTLITKEYFVPSAKITTEVKKVFNSEAEWVAFFGKPSPGIDFTQSMAIFYTPGTAHPDQQEAGYRTRMKKVSVSSTGKTLTINVGVEYNGDCALRTARPFVTATIKRPATMPTYKKFYRNDTVRDCE
jgi:hypothetical protein